HQRLPPTRRGERIAAAREARPDGAGHGAGTLHRAAGEEARPQRLRDLGLLEERREPLAPEPDRLRRREEARLETPPLDHGRAIAMPAGIGELDPFAVRAEHIARPLGPGSRIRVVRKLDPPAAAQAHADGVVAAGELERLARQNEAVSRRRMAPQPHRAVLELGLPGYG